jgi:hypothetical protein
MLYMAFSIQNLQLLLSMKGIERLKNLPLPIVSYNRTAGEQVEDCGKKSINQGCKNQAQYIVDPLSRRGFQSFHSPDGLLLDKSQKLVVNESEDDSL